MTKLQESKQEAYVTHRSPEKQSLVINNLKDLSNAFNVPTIWVEIVEWYPLKIKILSAILREE